MHVTKAFKNIIKHIQMSPPSTHVFNHKMTQLIHMRLMWKKN